MLGFHCFHSIFYLFYCVYGIDIRHSTFAFRLRLASHNKTLSTTGKFTKTSTMTFTVERRRDIARSGGRTIVTAPFAFVFTTKKLCISTIRFTEIRYPLGRRLSIERGPSPSPVRVYTSVTKRGINSRDARHSIHATFSIPPVL